MSATALEKTALIAPGPRGRLLVGNLHDFIDDFLLTMQRDFIAHGDIVRYRIGSRVVHVVSNPNYAQHILVDHQRDFPKVGGNGGLEIIAGNGLISNPSPESWLVQRRMMQPMFHRKRLAAMGEKIDAAGARMLARWQALPNAAQIDMNHEMLQVTLDIIMQTMFSADMLGEVGKLAPAVTAAVDYANYQIFNPFSLPLPLPTSRNRAYMQARNVLDSMIFGLIQQRRAASEPVGDLLDMLLEAQDADTGARMSDEQIRDEVLTIFAAGHETTANTLTFAWYLLGEHPEIRRQLQAELDNMLQGRTPSVNDLPNLPYTNQVFKEAMRLYPAAPITGPRRVTKPTQLGGYDLPVDSRVIVSITNLHRHPAFWENPLEFDPTRFAPNAKQPRHHLAFMPFGAGPRKCIGNNLAEMEGALLLACVAQHYNPQLKTGHQVQPEMAITMRAKGGMPMLLKRR
ncbi:cytochrome P450 [Herpetosiphon llansteffanensis]|uniref:cytochrome P450 n=1 Tax=Herpetosiphon llansteffanensis TaxID=2094568 RepID=UPI0013DEE6BC|nr:cytochrome P450 [Herpetosiphon llansteffanensis]